MTEKSIISTGPASERIILTDEERKALLQLGGLQWGEREIAAFFGWDQKVLHFELSDENSEISRLLLQGELKVRFDVESRLQQDAAGGNLTAARQFQEIMRDRSFRMTKLDLFGGADDTKLFTTIQKYIEDGCPGDLGTREQLYIDALQLVYSMNTCHGSRKTIRFLTKPPYNLSYDRAKDLMTEAIELFNSGRRNSKEAMRAHIADAYDTIYHAMMAAAKTPQELAMAAGILDKRAKLLQLDKEDPAPFTPNQYIRQYRIISLTPDSVGLPAANRDSLGSLIDALPETDREKKRLKMEGGIIPTDITTMLEDVTQEES